MWRAWLSTGSVLAWTAVPKRSQKTQYVGFLSAFKLDIYGVFLGLEHEKGRCGAFVGFGSGLEEKCLALPRLFCAETGEYLLTEAPIDMTAKQHSILSYLEVELISAPTKSFGLEVVSQNWQLT
jgi:hypothetical protein